MMLGIKFERINEDVLVFFNMRTIIRKTNVAYGLINLNMHSRKQTQHVLNNCIPEPFNI